MTNCSFDSAGGGLEGFCYLGIQYLGDGIDHVHVSHGDDDGFPQILVALDVGGDTDLMDDAGDHGLDVGLTPGTEGGLPLALATPDLLQPLYQSGHVTGLDHQIAHAQISGCGGYKIRNETGCSKGDGLSIQIGQGFQHG